MNAQRIVYGTRIITPGDHRRWCCICGTQRSTVRGVFVQHNKPNGDKCENSGKRVDKQEQAG